MISYVFFDQAMKLAAYIYSGLAISAVYKLKWTKVAGCILVSIVAGSVISGLFASSVPFRLVSWKVLPLMIEGIEEIQLGMNSTNSISLKAATLERGELVLVKLSETIFIRTVESGSTHFQGEVLAELVAVPGDKVTLESGTLLINDEVKHAADKPLPHLSLSETELGQGQYFIYFTSPALLGAETNPEQFLIDGRQVAYSVPKKMLSFVRWMAR
jgi:type IV secretory pathway protease TraF